ncbi:hypothetical protein [Catellatospora citrea]|uniref:Uncharacterized protein n=1 Tax=Catellatospora citrea TaxID=53366 RepID=A0A8J3KBR9_9ACTN|nr:hypothetical protein [Catellatospora citrea]RKE06043.1 hypothetical protein C8E86_0861 [Catellatospora citrea]GIF97709.1 hypothetical protein Cci01nite_28030 [Catellatospora citrea]
MSKVVSLIRLGHGTKFAKKVKWLSLQIFGKEVARYEIRAAPRALAAAGMRDLERLVKVITGAVVSEALKLYDRFLSRFPTILTGVERATFADIVAQAMGRGEMSPQSLRGLIVERLARSLPELEDMVKALDRVRLRASEKLAKKWGKVQLVGGVADGQGKQLGDLLVVSVHPDGRVWVLAVFESKSISNIDDLTRLKDLPVGQHLWDYVRAKGHGLIIDGRRFAPEKVVLEPVPFRARAGTTAVVGAKSTADRLAEMSGYYTQFIGFAPKEMSNNQALRIAAQGIQLELWRWPFDLNEYDKFQKALIDALDAKLK